MRFLNNQAWKDILAQPKNQDFVKGHKMTPLKLNPSSGQ